MPDPTACPVRRAGRLTTYGVLWRCAICYTGHLRHRLVYFHAVNQSQVRLLLIYRKGIKDDLSAK